MDALCLICRRTLDGKHHSECPIDCPVKAGEFKEGYDAFNKEVPVRWHNSRAFQFGWSVACCIRWREHQINYPSFTEDGQIE